MLILSLPIFASRPTQRSVFSHTYRETTREYRKVMQTLRDNTQKIKTIKDLYYYDFHIK